MSEYLSIEELIADDSFYNYCFQSNEVDVLFWEAYLEANPSESGKVQEARQIVIGMHAALKSIYGNDDIQPVETSDAVLNPQMAMDRKWSITKILAYSAAVAAMVLVLIGIKNFEFIDKGLQEKEKVVAAKPVPQQIFSTAKGERKSFVLPDSTIIKLNAGSTLHLDAEFGRKNRVVYLSGEALFNVTHNEHLPFIVRIANYDVKVLGTVFNVKAYPGEKISETALVKGKVQIVKSDGGDLTLVPNQKVVFHSISEILPSASIDSSQVETLTTQKIVPVHISEKDGIVQETAWAQDRLEIVNESFDAMKLKLERWYNVQIVFTDRKVAQYTFTATFEKENIQQVLEALQFTYPFNYKIEEGKITISK